jgi:hypothetical protein
MQTEADEQLPRCGVGSCKHGKALFSPEPLNRGLPVTDKASSPWQKRATRCQADLGSQFIVSCPA